VCVFSSFSVPCGGRDQQPSRFFVELRESGIEDADWNWTGFAEATLSCFGCNLLSERGSTE
jgi:hypothetical protein